MSRGNFSQANILLWGTQQTIAALKPILKGYPPRPPAALIVFTFRLSHPALF